MGLRGHWVDQGGGWWRGWWGSKVTGEREGRGEVQRDVWGGGCSSKWRSGKGVGLNRRNVGVQRGWGSKRKCRRGVGLDYTPLCIQSLIDI